MLLMFHDVNFWDVSEVVLKAKRELKSGLLKPWTMRRIRKWRTATRRESFAPAIVVLRERGVRSEEWRFLLSFLIGILFILEWMNMCIWQIVYSSNRIPKSTNSHAPLTEFVAPRLCELFAGVILVLLLYYFHIFWSETLRF